MGSKLKSIFKRQVSQPVKSEMKNTEEAKSIMQEMKSVPNDFLQRRRINGKSSEIRNNDESDDSIVFRRKIGPRRHNTSLGAIEDLLQCPICQDRLKSPRMMPCQHTFCQKCLEKQLDLTIGNRADIALSCPLCNVRVSDRSPDLLPTNLYIESLLKVMENPGEGWLSLASRNTVVSFAPLPERNFESGANGASTKSPVFPCLCLKCSITCSKDNRCRHCKQIFCDSCWLSHINELKVQLEKIIPQLESASCRFDNRIVEFRAKIDELKDSIEKDTETRIAELMQERDERIVRLNNQAAKGEESAKEAQRRIYKISNDLKAQTNGLYDSLEENNSKVKIFMSLQREATELMNLENSWNPELGEDDVVDSSMKISHVDLMNSRGDVDLFYRRKNFAPKLILSPEIVQRPCGMSHDPWRDHVFVACPGSRQIVVLDRKYKLFKRYQSTEMMAPQGLAYVETTEELFVTDKWKHCIFVFNRNGQVVRNMCKKGQSESQLSSPEGMTFYPRKNLLYVADTGNDRIQILELNGTFRGFIGPTERKAHCVTKTGKISGIVVNHLNQPTGVSVTDDCVIVADCGNHKVKIFNHEGILVHTIGGSGTLKRHFRSPEVVQVDTKGNIIVGDSGNARVQIFSPHGDLLRVLGGRTSNSNRFGWISGLLVKNNFEILIGDNKTNAVKIF